MRSIRVPGSGGLRAVDVSIPGIVRWAFTIADIHVTFAGERRLLRFVAANYFVALGRWARIVASKQRGFGRRRILDPFEQLTDGGEIDVIVGRHRVQEPAFLTSALRY